MAMLAAAVLLVAGCGGDSSDDEPPAKREIPKSVRAIASGAESTVDAVLAGRRASAVTSASALNDAAQGGAADELSEAGVPAVQIDELKARTAAVTEIAARGKPIDVALAANRVFELVPDFFEVYASRVPSEVTRLDYLESEARLQALAGDRGRVVDAVGSLDMAWKALGPKVVRAGGDGSAKAFDGHVAALDRLVKSDASMSALEGEAQRGRALIDDIEAVYAG